MTDAKPPRTDLEGTKVAIIGGCGHVGLPLGVKFALAGARTVLVDLDEEAVDKVNSGAFPFLEYGGDAQLQAALKNDLRATTDPDGCQGADVIVFVIGTPVDEHLNPKLSDVLRIFDAYKQYFSPESLVIMRSTLFPGTMEHLYERLKHQGIQVRLAFCPERVAQGYALDEIQSLPQIVSAFEEDAFELARDVFAVLAPCVIRLDPLEAEVAKLMANSWRYLEFAIANQFYAIAEQNDVDFHRVYQAIRYDYPRASGYKAPGFAAGPCLFKDTMQLASYFDHQFYLGHSAMLVNEGLSDVVVQKAEAQVGGRFWGKTAGVLGMTFKANNDDIRESLSFRVKRGLEFKGAQVLCHDPYIKDSTDLQELLRAADVIILATPHKEYRSLEFSQPVIDVWGFYGMPELEIHPGTNARGESREASK